MDEAEQVVTSWISNFALARPNSIALVSYESMIQDGRKLGRYEIRSKLGAGGMGEVYLAEDAEFHRKVALKVLRADVVTNNDRMRRFKQEATAAAALNHPNIAHIYLTNDVNNYNRLSMTAESSVLVTVQIETTASVWVAQQGDASRARQISSGKYDGQQGVAWMPGGNMFYTSREGGVSDIWIMDQDGKNQKQLTANAGHNFHPWATPDGHYFVFSSNRTTRRGIWRMDTDGSNLKQLTEGPGDLSPRTSPDGRWVVFSSTRSGSNRVWKISIDGGEPVQLTDKLSIHATSRPTAALWPAGSATINRIRAPRSQLSPSRAATP